MADSNRPIFGVPDPALQPAQDATTESHGGDPADGAAAGTVRSISVVMSAHGLTLELLLSGSDRPLPVCLSWPKAAMLSKFLTVLVSSHELRAGRVDLRPDDAALLSAVLAHAAEQAIVSH